MKGYVYISQELIKKVENITNIDYNEKGDLISIESLIDMVEDLTKEVEKNDRSKII